MLPPWISTWWLLVPGRPPGPHGLSPTPRWLCFRGTSSSAGMQPLARSTHALQEPAPISPAKEVTYTHIHGSKEPRNQGTKEPRLLIHRRRLLRTNERREGNCFSLGSRPDVCGGPRPRPASMSLRCFAAAEQSACIMMRSRSTRSWRRRP
jgi:hypothetical protein